MIVNVLEPFKILLNASYIEEHDLYEHYDITSFTKSVEEAIKYFHVIGALIPSGMIFAAFDQAGNEIAMHFISAENIWDKE